MLTNSIICISYCTKITRMMLDSSQKDFITMVKKNAGLVTAYPGN